MKRQIYLLTLLMWAGGFLIGWGIAQMTRPEPIPKPPVVIDGPVEPMLYRDPALPPPELHGEPEPSLTLTPEKR